MPARYVFVDEGGNLDFSPQGTRFFTLTSVTIDDCSIGSELLDLRRDITRRGLSLPLGFHASEDRQAVRDEVFSLIGRFDLRIDATIFEKAKANPDLYVEEMQFYKSAWFFHLQYVLPAITAGADDLLIVGATIPLRRRAQLVNDALTEVLGAAAGSTPYRVASWPAATDPCLQVADYCCWAVHRKWERSDTRSHVLLGSKLKSEFDFFRLGTIRYY